MMINEKITTIYWIVNLSSLFLHTPAAPKEEASKKGENTKRNLMLQRIVVMD